ncbi:hypothetical protein [Croceimicrobium sp.]|uniref:hypothetical protein n=1 Tax=Croceimicrobium sp. TaxID=2828340 RepID=UPI003BAA0F26
MRIGRKIVYYLLGVGLGSLLVFFIFGDRDIECNYFPNDRVLYDLRLKEIQLAPELNSGDTLDLQYALERARVDFDKSEINDEGCNVYHLDLKDRMKSFRIENCDSIATVLAVSPMEAN